MDRKRSTNIQIYCTPPPNYCVRLLNVPKHKKQETRNKQLKQSPLYTMYSQCFARACARFKCLVNWVSAAMLWFSGTKYIERCLRLSAGMCVCLSVQNVALSLSQSHSSSLPNFCVHVIHSMQYDGCCSYCCCCCWQIRVALFGYVRFGSRSVTLLFRYNSIIHFRVIFCSSNTLEVSSSMITWYCHKSNRNECNSNRDTSRLSFCLENWNFLEHFKYCLM